MRWQDRQDKVEASVYEAMNELADLLSIKIRDYPLVYWVGRKVQFKDLFTSTRYMPFAEQNRVYFEHHRRQKIPYYHHEARSIYIFKDMPIAVYEEAAHALHLMLANPSVKGRGNRDRLSFDILMEINGFLGARLIGSPLENPYNPHADWAQLTPESLVKFEKSYLKLGRTKSDFLDHFVHQQGYGLAECIHFAHLKGDIKLEFIRRLFTDRWLEKNSAVNKYLRLKRRFWPIDKITEDIKAARAKA